MRRILQALLPSIVIIAIVVFLSVEYRQSRQNDLNIVLISVDTVRPDHLSTYGYERETDPNLKKLAQNATVFQNVFTLIPQTYPSFAMLFTGKSPAQTGIFSNASPQNADEGALFQNTKPLTEETETLASILKKNGYQTVSFITSGILHDDFTGLSPGFDTFNLFEQYDINAWKQNREGYDAFVDKGVQWFSDNKQGKFFYWIHLMDPHSPYYPSEPERCLFQSDADCRILQSQPFSSINSFKSPYYACSDEQAPEGIVNRYKALYDAEITSADRQVGKILDALEKSDLMKDTLIIYYGDHGESFDHQYYFAHGESLYESTIRIPFILYHPLQKGTQYISTRITNVDILPTILDLVHIPYTKEQFSGKSFVSEMNSQKTSSQSDDYIYFSNYNLTKFAVMKGAYKYIISFPGACLYREQQEELYNVVSDPEEKHNLATMEKEIAFELKSALQIYISELSIDQSEQGIDSENTILDELKSLGY